MLSSDEMEAGFWQAIAEAPKDEMPRLVFADWLEERSDPRAPLLRHFSYAQHLNAECRDPVQAVLRVLDTSLSNPGEPLIQAATMVGASLVPALLERCRANKSLRYSPKAAELLATMSSECLLPFVSDLIDLLPRHPEVFAKALAQVGPGAVAAVPALLEAERTSELDTMTFARTITRIGSGASSPEVIARLVDLFCDENQHDWHKDLAEALAVVGQSRQEFVLATAMERRPEHFSTLAWKMVPKKNSASASLREGLGSTNDYMRWAAACALVGTSEGIVPHLLDALQRAPMPVLQPVVEALRCLKQKPTDAVPLLRELLCRPGLSFGQSVVELLMEFSDDPLREAIAGLSDPNPLVRQRIALAEASRLTKDKLGCRAFVNAVLDPDPGVRRAVAAYGTRYLYLNRGEQDMVAPLRQALADPDPAVRAGAADTLCQLKRTAAPAEPELLALLRQDPDVQVRRSAASTLARMEHETQAIFDGLVAGLDDAASKVRQVCAWGLCHWESMTGDRARVVLRRMNDAGDDAAWLLAFGVCRVKVAIPEAVAFLHDAVRKQRGDLASAAAVRLGRLQVDTPAVLADLFAFFDAGGEKAAEALCWVGPAAVPGLLQRLQQGSAKQRRELLYQIEEVQHRNPHLRDLLPGVLSCLPNEDKDVQESALKVLQGCTWRSAEGAELMEKLIWQAPDSNTRCAAIRALANISPDPQAVAMTFALLQRDPQAAVRAAVAGTLGPLKLSAKVEVEMLRVALQDATEQVWSSAMWRARDLGPAAAPLLPEILRILDGLTPGEWNWQSALRVLETMGPAGATALEAARARASKPG